MLTVPFLQFLYINRHITVERTGIFELFVNNSSSEPRTFGSHHDWCHYLKIIQMDVVT